MGSALVSAPGEGRKHAVSQRPAMAPRPGRPLSIGLGGGCSVASAAAAAAPRGCPQPGLAARRAPRTGHIAGPHTGPLRRGDRGTWGAGPEGGGQPGREAAAEGSQSQPGASEREERPGADVVSPDPWAGRGGTGGPPMRARPSGGEGGERGRERGRARGGEARPRAAASPPAPGPGARQWSSPRAGGREQERSLHSPGPGEKSRGFEAANHWGLLATLK